MLVRTILFISLFLSLTQSVAAEVSCLLVSYKNGKVSTKVVKRAATCPTGYKIVADSEHLQETVLQKGKTLRGTFAFSGFNPGSNPLQAALTSVTFPLELATAPTPHVIRVGGTPPSECPGTGANPAALAGHLCIYEVYKTASAASLTVFNPQTLTTDSAAPFGFSLQLFTTSADVNFVSYGVWAVKAP